MILWSGLLSPFSAKVRIACREKNISYELREINWSRTGLWGPKPPEFLAVSPRGQVPVLITDDGHAIPDSTIIMGVPVPKAMPHLAAWYQRMLARPSVGTEFNAMLAAAAARA